MNVSCPCETTFNHHHLLFRRKTTFKLPSKQQIVALLTPINGQMIKGWVLVATAYPLNTWSINTPPMHSDKMNKTPPKIWKNCIFSAHWVNAQIPLVWHHQNIDTWMIWLFQPRKSTTITLRRTVPTMVCVPFRWMVFNHSVFFTPYSMDLADLQEIQ